MPPKNLPTLTEIVASKAKAPSVKQVAVPESRPADESEVEKLLTDHEVARLEQQLVQSHWLEQRLSPALRDWVENEVTNEVAQQLETLAPLWAKALADAVAANVTARIPGIVDRLLDEAQKPTTAKTPRQNPKPKPG
jgi:hypothetical protein